MAVGFFTNGVPLELPHPHIPQRTILTLCGVIKRAWELLEESPPAGFILTSEHEDTITQTLVEIIENRLRQNGAVAGFNCALFGRVTRDQKIPNYNNRHPDKMPDIFFDLKRDTVPTLSTQDGLFVECKPVDSTHTAFSCYCKKGLIRFVDGDYAWAMQDALMVGYVKKPYSFGHLASALDNNNKSIDLKTINHSFISGSATYISNHKRTFEWPESGGIACSIEVTHLWLQV